MRLPDDGPHGVLRPSQHGGAASTGHRDSRATYTERTVGTAMSSQDPPRADDRRTESDVEATSDERGRRRTVIEFLQQFAAVAALLGGFFYVTLRVALTIFYGTFGVTPEEVGWDASRVLATFTASLVLLLIIIAIPASRAAVAVIDSRPELWRRLRTWLLPALVVVAFLAMFVVAPINARVVKGGGYFSPSLDRLFPVAVPCVRPAWVDGTKERLPTNAALLGYGAGVTVLFDADTSATLRIPTGSMVLTDCNSQP